MCKNEICTASHSFLSVYIILHTSHILYISPHRFHILYISLHRFQIVYISLHRFHILYISCISNRKVGLVHTYLLYGVRTTSILCSCCQRMLLCHLSLAQKRQNTRCSSMPYLQNLMGRICVNLAIYVIWGSGLQLQGGLVGDIREKKNRHHDNMKSQNCSGIFIRINKMATMVNFFHSSNDNSFQVSCYVFNLNLVDGTKVI